MENQPPTLIDRTSNWLRNSLTFKLFVIGFLILVLLIPISMIESIIRERQSLRDKATREVSSKWGAAQLIGGPVISVPYKLIKKKEDSKEDEVTLAYAHFLPENLNINGDVDTEKRKRGIYTVVLYNSKLKITGNFAGIDGSNLGIDPNSLDFNNAFLSVGISDLKGVKAQINFVLNGTPYSLDPGVQQHDIFASGVSTAVKIKPNERLAFQVDIDLNGSSSLQFLPFGKENNVKLTSKWTDPSFEGAFLPDNRTVDANGFNATWKVLHLNRNYPQQGTGKFIEVNQNILTNSEMELYGGDVNNNNGNAGAFGTRLLLPVDEYLKTNRSAKYSTMFVMLSFLVIFFAEILHKSRATGERVHIHAIQYLLVGFAACLFYLLLLSISEHLNFNRAYWISCAIILALIAFYVRAMFSNNTISLVITATLAMLYGFFFTLLQLEEYALLLGSFGLLVILGCVMYLTRNIDWYNVRRRV